MAPHRRASESHTHARALSAISARNNSISSNNSTFGGSGILPSRAERWAGTIRNHIRHFERDGLRRTFWNRRTFGTNAQTGGRSYFAQLWDRLRRMPELLLVEYEDPVDPNSPWNDGGNNEHDSSDTSDLLDEDGQQASRPSADKSARRASRKPQGHFRRTKRLLDRARRTLGVSRAALVLLILLLVLGIYESTKLGSIASRRSLYQNPLSLKINTRDPFKTLLQAGIDVQHPLASSAELAKLAVSNPKIPTSAQIPSSTQGKVTAIVLNWKRTDNLVVILAHLCAFTNTIFSNVIVWNNNPDTFLTHESFAASRCPKGKLRIHNSPGNLLFMARFMACSLAETPYVSGAS